MVDHTQYDTTSILATIEHALRPRAARLPRRGRERLSTSSTPRGRTARTTGARATRHRRAGSRPVLRVGTRRSPQAATRRRRKASAPALSSISLRLPHFGLWTHDGQPRRTGSPRAGAPCRRPSPRTASKPRSAIPTPPGVPVVDEDGRPPGLEVDVRREAADVPAVAHRPQRQQRDHRVLGRVQRAEQPRHLGQPLELLAARGRTRPPRSRTSSPAGRAGRSRASRLLADRLALVGDDLLGDRDARRTRARGRSGARRAAGSTIAVVRLLLHLRVPVAAERLDERGARGVVELARRGTTRRGGGRPRPRARSSTRARARRSRARRRSPRRRR